MATLLTIKQFCERQPGISESALRQAIFYQGDKLEESGCIVRMGRRILINEQRFLDFLASGGLRRIRGAA
ncbi:hypothetical protein ACQAYK_01140 [Acidithiobacillus sp. AC3]